MPSKKFQLVFTAFISFFISLVANMLFPAINGQSLTLAGWGMGVVICTLSSVIFCSVVPCGRFGAWFAVKCGASPDSTAGKLLIDFVLATIILVVLTVVMTIVNTGVGELGGLTVLDRIIGGVMGGYAMIVIVTILCDPLASAVAHKVVKE